MPQSWIQRYWELLLLAAIILVGTLLTVYPTSPIRNALEIGGDEHLEVAKGWLWAKGCSLYKEIWSDQPPLFTVLLGILFKCFGPQMLAARALAMAFGISFVTAFFLVIKRGSGAFAATIAALVLVVSPEVIPLCASVMQEVPALGTGLWALWALQKWAPTRQLRWLILSGTIFSIALEIKFTAAILGPALIAEIVLNSEGQGLARKLSGIFRAVIFFASASAIVFLLITLLFGGNYESTWALHFSKEVAQAGEEEGRIFSFKLLLDHTEAFWGTVVGVSLLLMRRQWTRAVSPIVLLLTAVAIHSHHRPWWNYYYLHFAIPLAWLTGHAIGLCRGMVLVDGTACGRHARLTALFGAVCVVALSSSIVGQGGNRLIQTVQWMKSRPIPDVWMIFHLKYYAPRTRVIYCPGSNYAFLAGLLVDPELTVVSRKRFWSSQLTLERLIEIVRQDKPEQVVLEGAMAADLKKLVAEKYDLVYEGNRRQLYVLKSISRM